MVGDDDEVGKEDHGHFLLVHACCRAPPIHQGFGELVAGNIETARS
jgi:hypothetical protein